MTNVTNDDATFALISGAYQRRVQQAMAMAVVEQNRRAAMESASHSTRIQPATAHLILNATDVPALTVLPPVNLLLQTLVVRGEKTSEGSIIEAVTLPWFDIIRALADDPEIAFKISAEKWEEMLAGAYQRAGFDEVILTPRSGDHGRDVIATKKGIGTIRVIDQMKAYKPGHLVTANDVRALAGVLSMDGASKGFVTTTSDFAPLLRQDPSIKPWFGSRLDLVNGTQLLARLQELGKP